MVDCTHNQHFHRFAWTVPVVLILGILSSLLCHLPIYTGILAGLAWSIAYAHFGGSGWKSISVVALQGVRRMWLICTVLLMIGAVVALWMACGTIPLLVSIGSAMLNTSNLVWMSFVIASVLSMIVGSSIATWSVLGPPLMAMAPIHSSVWVAGALLSGGMVGDRGSPMSTSTVLMSNTAGLPLKHALRRLNQSAMVPFVITGFAFATANRWLIPHSVPHMPTHINHLHFVLLIPPLLVIGLAVVRVPLLYNLAIALILGFSLTVAYTHPTLGRCLANVWFGLSSPIGHRASHIGGVAPMVTAVVLIASAGAFQGVTALGGSIDALTSRWFSRIRSPWMFVWSAYAVCALYAMMVGSQMLAILMSGNTLRPHFDRLGLHRIHLLQVMGDAAELLPALIPWNLLGLQAVVILGVPGGQVIPFAWYIECSLLISIVRLGLHVSRVVRIKKEQANTPVLHSSADISTCHE